MVHFVTRTTLLRRTLSCFTSCFFSPLQSYFYRHLHFRICHKSDGPWLYSRTVYLPAWCLELVGLYSYHFSVSICYLLFPISAAALIMGQSNLVFCLLPTGKEKQVLFSTTMLAFVLLCSFFSVTSQWESTSAIWQHLGRFVFCVLSRLSPSFPVRISLEADTFFAGLGPTTLSWALTHEKINRVGCLRVIKLGTSRNPPSFPISSQSCIRLIPETIINIIFENDQKIPQMSITPSRWDYLRYTAGQQALTFPPSESIKRCDLKRAWAELLIAPRSACRGACQKWSRKGNLMRSWHSCHAMPQDFRVPPCKTG